VSNLNLAFGIELEMTKKVEQRNKHNLYEGFRKFQNTWMTKLPCVEFVFDEKNEK
jgi:hypothetical protein